MKMLPGENGCVPHVGVMDLANQNVPQVFVAPGYVPLPGARSGEYV